VQRRWRRTIGGVFGGAYSPPLVTRHEAGKPRGVLARKKQNGAKKKRMEDTTREGLLDGEYDIRE
jgi:hypothetical protein